MTRTDGPFSPFKGLAAFDDSDLDALLFFGREREIEVIAANLQAARLTVLYGPSGVGKSSILRAGVAPRLRREVNAAVEIVDRWAGGGLAAVEDAIARRAGDVDLYLILDQFEEYFVYHSADTGMSELLAGVVGDAGSRVNVLVGIREDAVAQLDEFRRALPTLLSNRLGLERLDRAAAREAIVRPVARYAELTSQSVEVEPALVEQVLHDVTAGRVDLAGPARGGADGDRSDTIEAPYLQLVLQTVWEAERATGSTVLRAETLQRLGGAARIVEDHLEHAMADFTRQEKDAAAAMYNHLVTPSGTKIAHRVGDLARYASLGEGEASHVLEKLAQERIVRAGSEDGPASVRYEIFHDVLADAVLAWRARHEENAALRQAERRRRRAFGVATAALAALILVGAIAVYALVERGNSRAQARRARAEALAAEALTQLSIDPSASLRLADAAAGLRHDVREEAVLRNALQADRLRGTLRTGGAVSVVGYDASGGHEFVAGADGNVRVYRTRSSRPLRVFVQGSPVTAAAISADGRFVAGGGRNGSGRLWDVASGRTVRAVLFPSEVRTVAFARSGRLVLATNAEITVWRVRDGKRVLSISVERPARLVKVVVSPDGRRAVVVYRFRRAYVYDLLTGRVTARLAHNGFIQDAAYSPDGRLIATGGYAGSAGGIRLWDAHTGRLVRELHGALLHVDDVTFSPDGTLVGAASGEGTARVWETSTGTETAIMIGHQNQLSSVDFNPSGTALVSASSDGTARVWGASGGRAGRILAVLAGHRAPVVAAVFAPDGRSVLTAGEDGTARVWDPGSEPQLILLARSARPVTDLGVSADGRFLFIEHDSGEAEQRRLDGRLVGPVLRSDDVVSHGERTVRITRDGRTRVLRPPGAPVNDAALAPDGSTLAVAADDGAVQLWDAATGELRLRLLGHSDAVTAVAFSPDSSLVVSASTDRDARIWDVESGRLVQRLHGHFGPVLDARFSPDGRWVVTAGPITAGLWLVHSSAPPIFLDAPVERPLSSAAFAGHHGRLVVAASLDGSVRAYRCDICGTLDELLSLARRRLAAER